MKKKKVLLVLFHMAVIVFLALCMLKFPEEIIELKAKLRTTLYSAKNGIQASSFAEFDAYDPFTHTGNEWYHSAPLVYHAAGGIDGLTYSNSKDALEQTLQGENRVIEVDFIYTSDQQLVCVHDWHNIAPSDEPMSLEQFQTVKIFGKYAPLTAAELVDYMRSYPDLHIIIDTKESDAVQVVTDLVALCEGDAALISRFVIQLYDFEGKDLILSAYPFADENFLFTAYKYGTEKPSEILKYCYKQNIAVITVPKESWSAEIIAHFTDLGFVLYEHTVNRPDEAREALQRGIHGLYTDFLTREDLLP